MKTTLGAAAQPMPRISLQTQMAPGDVRSLLPEEVRSIRKSQERWIPDIIQHYGTNVSGLMSSPARGALLAGLLGGAGGGLGGAALGHHLTGGNPTAATAGGVTGGLLGAGILGAREYFSRAANNEGLTDMLRRLRPGATMRDLRSDPIYEKDLDSRRAPYRGGDFFQSDDYAAPPSQTIYQFGLPPALRSALLQSAQGKAGPIV